MNEKTRRQRNEVFTTITDRTLKKNSLQSVIRTMVYKEQKKRLCTVLI